MWGNIAGNDVASSKPLGGVSCSFASRKSAWSLGYELRVFRLSSEYVEFSMRVAEEVPIVRLRIVCGWSTTSLWWKDLIWGGVIGLHGTVDRLFARGCT